MLNHTLRTTARPFIRSAAPQTTRRAFATGSHAITSTSAGTCPVTPAVRLAFVSSLVLMSVYLVQNPTGFDYAFAPRSGLHYPLFASAYTPPAPSERRTGTASREKRRSTKAPSLSLMGGEYGGTRELRIAGVIGRSLSW